MLFDTVVLVILIEPDELTLATPPPWLIAMFPVITSLETVRTLSVRIPPPFGTEGDGGCPGQVLAFLTPSVRPFVIRALLIVAPTAPLWMKKTRSVRLPSITVPPVPEPTPLTVIRPTSLKM